MGPEEQNITPYYKDVLELLDLGSLSQSKSATLSSCVPFS